MNKNRLTQLFFEHAGNAIDKWEQYLSIYSGEFAPFIEKGQPVRLLEIGVQNGGSLEVWSKYLPQGSQIVGLDVDPKVGGLVLSGNISVLVADINDTSRVMALLGSEPFDIIVDDGSHKSSDIKTAFRTLFGKLREGGLFIAEDLHASYFGSHEGGFRLRSSSIEFFKDMIDALNVYHFEPVGSLTEAELAELRGLGRWIGRVTFYDSVAVVQKLGAEKKNAYRRLLSGTICPVVNPVDGLLLAPPAQVKTLLVGEATAKVIDLDLVKKIEAAAGPQKQLDAAEVDLIRLRSERDWLRKNSVARASDAEAAARDRDAMKRDRDAMKNERDAMRASASWRVTAPVRMAHQLIRSGVKLVRWGGKI